ncbi:MAG TPA: iron ABC transporter permease [Streptosporangiaceae bacterium]|jgi:iron(III) transport system permease protein
MPTSTAPATDQSPEHRPAGAPRSAPRAPFLARLRGRNIPVTAVLLAILAVLVLVPLVLIVWQSLTNAPPGEGASFTFEKITQVYGTSTVLPLIRNSAEFAIGSTVVAFVIGTGLAYLTERTNVPFRRLAYALILFPLVVPGTVTTTAWMLLLDKNVGLLNYLLTLVGVHQPIFSAYSMWSMIWMQGADRFALPFLLMAAAFRTLDPGLEEASAMSGASFPRTFRTVTLPVLRPAIVACLLILFVENLETFEVPGIIGIPAHIPVFATYVYLLANNVPYDVNLASAVSLSYIAVALIAVWIYYRSIRQSERFAVVGGKNFRPDRLELRRARKWVTASVMHLVLLITVVLPLAMLVYLSLLSYYHTPAHGGAPPLSLASYRWVLDTPEVGSAFVTNFEVGIISGLVAMLLAAVIAWVVVRTKAPGRKLIDGLAFAPIAIPGTVLGLALAAVYLAVPIGVYGTIWILVIAYVSKYVSYAVRATHSSLTQVDASLEEAATASGAGGFRVFRTVTLPLIAPGALVAFLYVVTLTFKALSLPIMLTSANATMLPVLTYNTIQAGNYSDVAALGVVTTVGLAVLTGISALVSRRFGVARISGAL